MLSETLKNYLLILGVLLVSADHLHQSVLILSISLFFCCLSRLTGGESKNWPSEQIEAGFSSRET